MATFIMKKTTGDVWKFTGRNGVWEKIYRGLNTKRNSKPVGYITDANFFPFHNRPGRYRVVERLVDSCGGVVYA